MGPMMRSRPLDRKRFVRWTAASILALFVWSFIAAPAAQTEEAGVVEPESLSAYNAVADATPVTATGDMRLPVSVVPVSVGPSLVHSTSEVGYPSSATSIGWLLNNGLLNSFHGLTTGTKVPTEVTASQPGGAEKEEFVLRRENVGNSSTARVGAGVVRATAEHSDRPRAYTHGYLTNLVLLPAPGSPEEAPGTYDPNEDAAKEKENPTTFPVASPTPSLTPQEDDPRAFTPNPRQQMGLVTVGSVSSASETLREDDRAVSIAVAEINGLNIGNRTGDGRCTNCFTIDSIRLEARAESNATGEGALAAWRLLIHRACRVSTANDAQGNAYEQVQCLNPDPDTILGLRGASSQEDFEKVFGGVKNEVANGRGVRYVNSDELNAFFASGGGLGETGIRMYFGGDPKKGTDFGRNEILEGGQVAKAFARGLNIEVTTAVPSRYLGEAAMYAKDGLDAADKQCADAEKEINQRGDVALVCPGGAAGFAKQVRTVALTFGRVRAEAIARPGFPPPPADDDDGPLIPQIPTINIPTITIPEITIPAQTGGGGQTVVVGGGIGPGKLRLKVNWSTIRLKPWAPKDMAKAVLSGGFALSLAGLVRRRLGIGL